MRVCMVVCVGGCIWMCVLMHMCMCSVSPAGFAALGLVFASQLVESLEALPLAPQMLQQVGVLYCSAALW